MFRKYERGLEMKNVICFWDCQQINDLKVHIFLLFTLYSKKINEIDRKYS